MNTMNFEALMITLGVLGLVGMVTAFAYFSWVRWLEAKHGKLHQDQINALEQRIDKLESKVLSTQERHPAERSDVANDTRLEKLEPQANMQ